jgi:hypothetical protein
VSGDVEGERTMHGDIQVLFDGLEAKKMALLAALRGCADENLRFQPAPDRWSIIMCVDHIVRAERGMRLTEAELRDHPLRRQLAPGKLFEVVLEVLEKDVPVAVPDAFLEPENTASLKELSERWERERRRMRALLASIADDALEEVRFSHPAAGPLDPRRALRLAHAHFDTHRRQIDRLMVDIGMKKQEV